MVDNGVQQACEVQCGGSPQIGAQICLNGSWGSCIVEGTKETCDGQDNDCDGFIDEGIEPIACNSACGAGTQSCVNGLWSACSAPAATVEICGDGQDNDCDGLVDAADVEGCQPTTLDNTSGISGPGDLTPDAAAASGCTGSHPANSAAPWLALMAILGVACFRRRELV